MSGLVEELCAAGHALTMTVYRQVLREWRQLLLTAIGIQVMSLALAFLFMLINGCAGPHLDGAPQECAPFPSVDGEFKLLLADAIPLLNPSDACIGQPHAVTIVSDPSEMPDVCHRDTGLVVGCNAIDMNGFPHVWILDCQDDPINTARHERLHTLLICEGGDDPDHDLPVWDELGVR